MMELLHNQEASALERREAVLTVVGNVLEKVKSKYGTGVNDGESPKYYHNYEHTKHVLECVQSIADLALKNGKITERDVELLEIAAAGHDLEQGFGTGLNEQMSAQEAGAEMMKTDKFTTEDIQRVYSIILATVPVFKEGVMTQSVTDDYLTRIIADADLASLGEDPQTYWKISQGLLREIKNTNTPTLVDQIAWAKGQIMFLSNHQFHTPEANAIFPNKEANIAFAKEQVARLEEELAAQK